jgi:predicted amidohydrolase YtcJ
MPAPTLLRITARTLTALALALAITSPLHAQSSPAGAPDLILFHGKIWTENPSQPQAEAVAIANNQILAVGSSAEIQRLAGPQTRTIDLNNRRVLPGFNDAHVHLIDGGKSLLGVQLHSATSLAEFRQLLAAYARTQPQGQWILGGNWDEERWTPANLPTHADIDAVTPNNPVFVERLDGHEGLANSLAMQLAHIDRNTPDISGGVIVRDSQGNPTGIFKDAAKILIYRAMPPIPDSITTRAILAAQDYAFANGVTSVQTMASVGEDAVAADELRTFQSLARSGQLRLRVSFNPPLVQWTTQSQIGIQAGFGTDHVHIGGLKAFADGSLGSRTAWMLAPYSNDPSTTGIPSASLANPAKMYDNVLGADRAGLQVCIHAIGDRANRAILDLYQKVIEQDGPRDRRFRIEHAQHLTAADIPRFGQLHIIASMQPYHLAEDGQWAEPFIGPDRAQTSYAWHSLLDSGAVLAFGSDWPVTPMQPLLGIWAAVTRESLDGKHPNGWVPAQRITVAEAVHAYTAASAYAEFRESAKGSIIPGKLADIIVLDHDIFQIPPDQIKQTRVDFTILDGNIVFQRK